MRLLAEAFVHPSVQDLAKHCVACGGATQDEIDAVSTSDIFILTFKEFNLKHVLEKGQALLASGGQVRPFSLPYFIHLEENESMFNWFFMFIRHDQEYDTVEDPSLTVQQRRDKQRQQLKKRLGAWESGSQSYGMNRIR